MSLNSCLYLGGGTLFRSEKSSDLDLNTSYEYFSVNSTNKYDKNRPQKQKICFIDKFPIWLADLQRAAPTLEFVVKKVEQIASDDIVIVDNKSTYNFPNAIVATGKKHLWRKLCEIMITSL